MKPIRFFRLALLVGSVFLLSRCGDKTPASGTFGNVYQVTLKTTCIECHRAGNLVNGTKIDFTSQASAYTTLTAGNVVGAVSVGTCGTRKLVVAGDTANSFLPATLFADFRDGAGKMKSFPACTPFVTDHSRNLSDAEKTSILTWIGNGARND